MSPIRAAAIIEIITVADPLEIMPGPFGTQLGKLQGSDMSVTRAAAILSINTVGAPGGIMASGSAGCGTGVGTGAGGWIGAWQCGASCNILSETRAAAGMAISSPNPRRERWYSFTLKGAAHAVNCMPCTVINRGLTFFRSVASPINRINLYVFPFNDTAGIAPRPRLNRHFFSQEARNHITMVPVNNDSVVNFDGRRSFS